MKKKRIMASFPIRILAVSIPGLLAGLFLNVTRTMGLTSGALNLVVTARYVLSQIITFLAPLIIIGLVASSIISVKKAPTYHKYTTPRPLHTIYRKLFYSAKLTNHHPASLSAISVTANSQQAQIILFGDICRAFRKT